MLSGRKHDKIWFMEEIKKQLQQAIKKVLGQEIEPELTVPPAETGADYATNVAMRLAKPLRKAPMLIAEELKVELESSLSGVKIEVAAPLAAMKKPIRGKMAENAPRGLILPEFGDEIGLGLLKAGLEVEIDYGINERTGLLRFQVL